MQICGLNHWNVNPTEAVGAEAGLAVGTYRIEGVSCARAKVLRAANPFDRSTIHTLSPL
jgi:hypothetical protein